MTAFDHAELRVKSSDLAASRGRQAAGLRGRWFRVTCGPGKAPGSRAASPRTTRPHSPNRGPGAAHFNFLPSGHQETEKNKKLLSNGDAKGASGVAQDSCAKILTTLALGARCDREVRPAKQPLDIKPDAR